MRRLFREALNGPISSFSVPVPATNVPLRVVMEIGKNGIYPQRKGMAVALYEQLRYSSRQWLYPDNPARWNRGRAPLCRITNEFNFGRAMNAVPGKETGR